MKGLWVLVFLLFGCASVGEVKLVDSSAGKPEFVRNVPKDCIVGFSSGVEGLEKGKRLALIDAMEQITGAIGSEIHVDYESRTEVRGRRVARHIKDTGRWVSAALLKEVEPNVRQIYFEKYEMKTGKGVDYFYDTYVLVYFPKPRMRELRNQVLKENKKRLAQFKASIGIAQELEHQGDFIGSVRSYVFAEKVAELLFKDKLFYSEIAHQGLDSILSSLKIAKVKENRYRLTLKATFRNGMPVKNLPLNISLKKGNGYIPEMIFTDDSGLAVLDISGVTTIAHDNRIKVRPGIKTDRAVIVDIDFSTVPKKPIVEASLGVDVFEVKGLLVRKVDKAVLVLRVKEINDVDFSMDRYRMKATAYYPIFMKDGFDTAEREAEFFLAEPVRLKGNSEVVRIQLDDSACRMISDLMKDRRPAKLRIDIGLSDESVLASTNDFSL